MTVKDFCICISTLALASVVGAMCWMFGYATIDPTVDTKEVFAHIGPAFQTIVGGFIGLITGIRVGEARPKEKEKEGVSES
jgi:hypothetical protein